MRLVDGLLKRIFGDGPPVVYCKDCKHARNYVENEWACWAIKEMDYVTGKMRQTSVYCKDRNPYGYCRLYEPRDSAGAQTDVKGDEVA